MCLRYSAVTVIAEHPGNLYVNIGENVSREYTNPVVVMSLYKSPLEMYEELHLFYLLTWSRHCLGKDLRKLQVEILVYQGSMDSGGK